MKIHRENRPEESERGKTRTDTSVGELQRNWHKKRKKKKREKAAKNGWTRKNKSWKVWSRFPARSCVLRAYYVGKLQLLRMCIVRKKSVDVQTRSHANSHIYLHITPIMHARVSKHSSLVRWEVKGCTTPIIRTSCFLAWRTGLKDVKYAWWCRIMLTSRSPHVVLARIGEDRRRYFRMVTSMSCKKIPDNTRLP